MPIKKTRHQITIRHEASWADVVDNMRNMPNVGSLLELAKTQAFDTYGRDIQITSISTHVSASQAPRIYEVWLFLRVTKDHIIAD